jgi:uncharacterized membrane protein
VQVDPIKPTVKVALKLQYDQLLSTFAFKFNLRRYNENLPRMLTLWFDVGAAAAAHEAGGKSTSASSGRGGGGAGGAGGGLSAGAYTRPLLSSS